MSKEPSPRSDFPLPADKVDEQIADVGRMADRDFERFGWNEKKPSPPPKRKRSPRKKKANKQ